MCRLSKGVRQISLAQGDPFLVDIDRARLVFYIWPSIITAPAASIDASTIWEVITVLCMLRIIEPVSVHELVAQDVLSRPQLIQLTGLLSLLAQSVKRWYICFEEERAYGNPGIVARTARCVVKAGSFEPPSFLLRGGRVGMHR